MQVSTFNNNFYDNAHHTVVLVDGARSVYVGLKNTFKGILAFFLIAVLATIVLAFINRFVLKRSIVKLIKYLNSDMTNLSELDYRKLRVKHEQLGKDLKRLSKLSKIEVDKAPRFLKKTVRLSKEYDALLNQKYTKDKEVFESLNSKLDTYKGFEALTEEALWKDRPSPYEYVL